MKYPPAPLTPFLASSPQNLRRIPPHSSATTYHRSRRNTLPFLLPFVFKNLQLAPPTHRFVSHAFSCTYELPFSQLHCFQKHLRCPMLFSSVYSVHPASVPSVLGRAFKSFAVNGLPPLVLSCLSFLRWRRLFSVTCGLFCKTPGVGGYTGTAATNFGAGAACCAATRDDVTQTRRKGWSLWA
jgi:hypothetical protein